jgi:hypothetical protein
VPDRTTIDGGGVNRASAATACGLSQSTHSTHARAMASSPPARRERGAQPT